MKPSYLKAVAVSVALAAGGAHAATNLVDDGSFESIAVPPQDYIFTNQIGGWISDTHGIEIRNQFLDNAYDGNNFVELDVDENSSMYQQLATTAGQAYELSFAYMDRPGLEWWSQGLEVTWNGEVLGTYIGAASWEVVRLTVHAVGDTSVLGFRALGESDGRGSSLDAVSVTAVPEPHTYALLLGGLALLGAGARRRR